MNQEIKRLRHSFANKLSLLEFDHEFETIKFTPTERFLIRKIQVNIEKLSELLKGE